MRFNHTQLRLAPTPKRYELTGGRYLLPRSLAVVVRGVAAAPEATSWLVLSEALAGRCRLGDDGQITLILRRRGEHTDVPLPAEGYALTVTEHGVQLLADDDAGLLYGTHSLVQLLGAQRVCGEPDVLPCLEILDWPHFPFRAFMPDLGRSVYSPELLQHLIRLCSRLKLNALHLHLHDNELNPVRYPDSPLGAENPFAMSLDTYADLFRYAARWQVEIVPELESWGHVGSILQHYPHLYGASRPHGQGHSFAVGPEMFALLERLYDPWLQMLPNGGKLHVGMDEANWYRQPDADPAVYNRAAMPQLVLDLVEARAAACGKQVETIMWADIGLNNTLSRELRNRLILSPWAYHLDRQDVDEIVRRNAMPPSPVMPEGKGPAKLICGMGMSAPHEFGAFAASRRWMERVKRAPNCLGGDVCMWATNDLAGRLLGLYAGAEVMWDPDGIRDWYLPSAHHEEIAADLSMRMKLWQMATPDADPEALHRVQGPEVYHGVYRWGDRAGERVAPEWHPDAARCGHQAP